MDRWTRCADLVWLLGEFNGWPGGLDMDIGGPESAE